MTGDQAYVLAKNYTKQSLEGAGALKGKDGFSPIITENPDNTEDIYKLDITTAYGTFTTPDLKGDDGEGASKIDEIKVNGTPLPIELDKSVDITVPELLTSIEQVSANTDKGHGVDALVVKSLDGKQRITDKVLQSSMNGISKYPHDVGVHRVIGKIAGLPSDSGNYGVLLIYGIGYTVHMYIDVVSAKFYIGVTQDSIVPPTIWKSFAGTEIEPYQEG